MLFAHTTGSPTDAQAMWAMVVVVDILHPYQILESSLIPVLHMSN